MLDEQFMRNLEEQANVHVSNKEAGYPCVGLPFCASCRTSVLLNNELNVTVAEAWISAQEPGTVCLRR